MKTFYVEYTLPGRHTLPVMLSALGDEVRNGLVVRLITTPTETRIVLAFSSPPPTTANTNKVRKSQSLTEAEAIKLDFPAVG